MAHWIDRAALWAFAVATAFFLMLSLTDGSIILSAAASFMLIILLRFLIQRLPERRWLLYGERVRHIRHILARWAIMPPDQVKSAIRDLLPSLVDEHQWQRALIVQLLPGGILSADQLLALRREHSADEEVLFICTCPAGEDALTLLKDLPPCRLIDGRQLTRALMRVVRTIPAEDVKKERRQPFYARIAPFVGSVRPFRTGFYALLFAALYVTTRHWPYLLATALFLLLIVLRMFFETRSKRAG